MDFLGIFDNQDEFMFNERKGAYGIKSQGVVTSDALNMTYWPFFNCCPISLDKIFKHEKMYIHQKVGT
jgi:hypothetical protein